MEFIGRAKLESDFADYFKEYKSVFLASLREPDSGMLRFYSQLYDGLLCKNFRTEQASRDFKEQEMDINRCSKAFLNLMLDFSRHLQNKDLDPVHLNYLANAIDVLRSSQPSSTRNIHAQGMATGSNFVISSNFSAALAQCFNERAKLHFFNLYDGVPIECEGEILRIEGELFVAKVSTLQILAMKHEGKAFLVKNEALNNNLKANIAWINVSNDTVGLNAFELQDQMTALRRKFPRVHPNVYTPIKLMHEDGRELLGKLFDISEGGMGVVSMQEAGFKNGDELSADIELLMPATQEKNRISLRFKLVVLINYQNAFRYCLQILPNQEATLAIREFSRQRVRETIEQLEESIKNYS